MGKNFMKMNVYPEFNQELKNISIERIKMGIDIKLRSCAELSKAIMKDEKWLEMKHKLIMKDFNLNKKGQIDGLIVLIVVFTIVLIFAGIIVFGLGIFNTTFQGINGGNVNLSNSKAVVHNVNGMATPIINNIITFVFFALVISYWLTGYFIGGNVIYSVIYILTTIITCIVSIPLSNFYQNSVLASSQIGSGFADFTAVNFIMSFLFDFTLVIGFIGIIVLFIGKNQIQGE